MFKKKDRKMKVLKNVSKWEWLWVEVENVVPEMGKIYRRKWVKVGNPVVEEVEMEESREEEEERRIEGEGNADDDVSIVDGDEEESC